VLKITLRAPPAPAVLEAAWRELETKADISFFQSWTWTGCLFAERFTRPLLLRAERDGVVVALGLFQRGLLSLHLGETGVAARDTIYIEHNGLLRARDGAPSIADLLRAILRQGVIPRRVRLSGVDTAHHAAASEVGGRIVARRAHVAPMVDLSVRGRDWIAGLSANTRQQLRRSTRAYGAPIVERAQTVAQAHDFLDALAALHQKTWRQRGLPGAFAEPFFRRFHRELIARGLPRDEIDLLRVHADGATIGYLYNFRHRGHVLAYQSGFDYAAARGAQKPGMTCHQLAIDMYAAAGAQIYDFLAGDHRYKRSLANGQTRLYWLTLYPPLAAWQRR
jgi:CelD/BcsL family acetyltransferase involved in cellulose biosynthesis